MKRILIVLGICLLGSGALNLFLGWKAWGLRSANATLRSKLELQAGAAVPPIKAIDKDGRPVLVTFTNSDRPTLLYFFSPACEACERNIENVKQLVSLKAGEYRIVGFSLTDEDLARYVGEHDLNFPVYSGLGIETTLAYKLGRVPQTAIVSTGGRVLANWYGTYDGELGPAISSYFQMGYLWRQEESPELQLAGIGD